MTDFTSNSVNDQTPSESGFGGRITKWLAGITGILVVVPSLINAGADIYISVLNVPRTHAEAVNKELYEKYFGKDPIKRLDLPLQTNSGAMNMELEIHGRDGDIFVRYGSNTQWFQSPLAEADVAAAGLLGTAFAQEVPHEQITGDFTQVEIRERNKIIRERYYSDGTKESFVINPRTGVWSEPSIERYEALPRESAVDVEVRTLPGIDLRERFTE